MHDSGDWVCVLCPCQAGPSTEHDGLHKGQVAGIVVGCVLFGILAGAVGMLCWLKRKRLFPQRLAPSLKASDSFGPLQHSQEAGSNCFWYQLILIDGLPRLQPQPLCLSTSLRASKHAS